MACKEESGNNRSEAKGKGIYRMPRNFSIRHERISEKNIIQQEPVYGDKVYAVGRGVGLGLPTQKGRKHRERYTALTENEWGRRKGRKKEENSRGRETLQICRREKRVTIWGRALELCAILLERLEKSFLSLI